MTFIDVPRDDSDKNKKSKAADSMDSANQQKDEHGKQVENIGLTGGQSEDSKSGVDMSQYTGPQSKPSSSFKDPEAKFKTGPGNGLSSDENENQEANDNSGDPDVQH